MGLANPIRDDLQRAGLLPDPLPEHSAVNSRGEGVDPTVDRRTADLEADEVGFLQDGGWTAVSIKGDGGGGGLTSHRGVLHPDEHVDHEALVAAVEAELGFTFDEIHSVYSTGGRIPDSLRGLRGRIDARLLALSRSGTHMAWLGRIAGVAYDPTIKRALARARAAEEVAS